MLWNGQELRTHGEFFDAFVACADTEQRRTFLLRASAENPHAIGNIKYMCGYCDQETAKRLYRALTDAVGAPV